jgi:hypothetical protein
VFGVGALCWLPTALRPLAPRLRAGMTVSLVVGYFLGSVAVAWLIFPGAGSDTALARMTDSSGLAVRLSMWRSALDVAASAPLLGVGFGEFAAHQYWVARPGPGVIPTPYAHNLILQTAAELGWPMAVALSAGALWWFSGQFKPRMRDANNAFAWILVFFVFVHALVEWPLALLYFSIPAAILFAVAEPRLVAGKGTAVFGAQLVALVGLCGVLLAIPMRLEFDELAGTLERAEAELKSRKAIDDGTLSQLVGLGESARFRLFAELYLATVRSPTAVAATDEEIARHERFLVRGGEPPVIARLVILCAKAGRFDEARRHAERLRVFKAARHGDLNGMVLDAIKDIGPDADALRAALGARDLAAPPPAPIGK